MLVFFGGLFWVIGNHTLHEIRRDPHNCPPTLFKMHQIWLSILAFIPIIQSLIHFNAKSRNNVRLNTIQGTKSDSSEAIQVWDNTLSSETLCILHSQSSQRGLGHNIFRRKNDNINTDRSNEEQSKKNESLLVPLSPLEQTLDDLLTKCNDTSPIVEYWSRQEWKHIEAHADIDELLVREQKKQKEHLTFRYPKHGHVLYLQVGSSVRGPTCLFPTCQSGGDLLSSSSSTMPSISQRISIDDELDHNGEEAELDLEIPLITVPAVPSRLLRFRGDILHTVPRPADLWFRKFVMGAPKTDPEEEWGRSVILFNTWEDGDDAPFNVFPVDNTKEQVTDQNSIHDNKSKACQINQLSDEHRSKMNAKSVEEWRSRPIVQYDNVKEYSKENEDTCTEETEEDCGYTPAKIWLLGDYDRRKYMSRTVTLYAPENQMRATLEDPAVVHETILRKKPIL